MFWKYNTNSSSQIESLLAKEDVTLKEVMDSEEIINECRVQNKMLIDFLQKTEVMEELVTLISKEPSVELEEKTRFKYPNIACELLTCDVPALNERLARDEVLLDKLYTFLECEPPLNPLLASYFSKIMGTLLARKTEQNWLSYQFTCLQVLDFLKAKDTFIRLLLKHLGTSAIMDLMLKLMTQVEGVETGQNMMNWLDSQRIVQSLVALLNPKIDRERHFNVAQLLCDFVWIARDTQRNSMERTDTDSLLQTLESPETVSLLLDQILAEERCETAIAGGIHILLALLDVYPNSYLKFSAQNIYNSNITEEQKQKMNVDISRVIKPRIKDFQDILLNPPKTNPISTTYGVLDPPFGNTRLQVTKLFAACILSNDKEVLEEIMSCGTFSILLDLFFQYQWNNFLHTQVENCLISALKLHSAEESEGNSNALTKHLLVNCKLIERLLNAWKENDEQQSQGIRKGYMGHLISIVNKIVELCSTSKVSLFESTVSITTPLGQYLKDSLPDVAKFLDEFKETTLSEINKIQDTLLGGVHPDNSVEENEDYDVIPFLQRQMFSQYQTQNVTAQYIDGYGGFNDDAFNDGDDTLQTIDHRTDLNFDLSEGDLVQQQEMFKQVCAQNINTLDDADDQIFEDREHTFQTVIEKRDRNEAVDSSDSDDEAPGEDNNMDVDPWASPKPTESKPPEVVNSDPWGADFTTQDATVGGWADFSSASFEADFSAFNDSLAKRGITETKTVVESDLKVENIESQTDLSKEENPNGIDRVAQTETTSMAPGDDGKSAAGGQGDVTSLGDKSIDVMTQPSKNVEEGDHSTQSGSSDKIKTDKEKV